MKYIFLPIFLILSLPSFSQIIISGVDINALDSVNICIVKVEGTEQILMGEMDVSVDYGQVEKRTTRRFTDKLTGKRMKFNSMTHVLNYMENNGWNHYDSQILDNKMATVHYFYFRKKNK